MEIISLLTITIGSIFVSAHYPTFTVMGLIILNANTILRTPIISKDTTELEVIVFGTASCGLRHSTLSVHPQPLVGCNVGGNLAIALTHSQRFASGRIRQGERAKFEEIIQESEEGDMVADDDVQEELSE